MFRNGADFSFETFMSEFSTYFLIFFLTRLVDLFTGASFLLLDFNSLLALVFCFFFKFAVMSAIVELPSLSFGFFGFFDEQFFFFNLIEDKPLLLLLNAALFLVFLSRATCLRFKVDFDEVVLQSAPVSEQQTLN